MLFLKKHAWWMLSIVVGLGISVLILDLTAPPPVVVEVPPPVIESSEPPKLVLRAPPSGETYGTGYWDDDKWHRTAPPAPEKISVDGEMLTYEDLRMRLSYGSSDDHRKVYQHLIEAYPYSELALQGRYSLAGDVWPDKSLLLLRYKEMLKYHPDSPRVLQKLAQLTEEDAPEESIFYATEALKYVDLYPSDSTYGLWTEPEEIHGNLGMAYQRVGDYGSALVHLKKTRDLIYANPGRRWGKDYADDVIVGHIEAIENGNPIYGPPSEVVPFEVYDESLSNPFNLPPVSDVPDVPDVPESGLSAADADVGVGPQAMPADPVLDPGRDAAAQQARDAFVQRQQQEFDAFLRWVEAIESAKSPSDLEDFLMHEMAKHLQGEATRFESERVLRAHEVLDRFGEKEGLKRLEQVDPELAREIRRQRLPIPKK